MGSFSGKHGESDSDSDEDEADLPEHTTIPAECFATPERASMSGGTAQFFKLSYVGPVSGPLKEKYGQSSTYWLGKDVARALDELPFYERVLNLPSLPTYRLLKNWTMSYAGVLSARVSKRKAANSRELEEKTRHLLVLRDISDGMERKRMLDIKLGNQTAVAGWQGKSSIRARTQSLVDAATNSALEGYRVEGLDNPPASLESQDHGERWSFSWYKPCNKKRERYSMQVLQAKDFLRYFTDTNDFEPLADRMLPIEYSEAVLFDAIRQMARLCSDALAMPAAQMWIGSSLCLAFDAGSLPSRQATIRRLAAPRPMGPALQASDIAKVCIFDWGRSELNTEEENAMRSSKEQAMRKKYWKKWLRGMLRCLFEAVHLYISQFNHSAETVTLQVWDYDHFEFDANDFVGSATLPLQATDGPMDLDLWTDENRCSNRCSLFGGERRRAGSIRVEISEAPAPSPGRLTKVWEVFVQEVEGLPNKDVCTETDPLVVVHVGSDKEDAPDQQCATASTPVVYDDCNAVIEHSMSFALVSPDVLAHLFSELSQAFDCVIDPALFEIPAEEKDSHTVQADITAERFEAFLAAVPSLASLASTGQKH
eukprot:TRINITY_DN50884_c0_g1_i1.p1 TRINITY_DN50884_c0_g1~~TRINITY_DN50884_c0_g1_i1.p1  ORF type:complete len:597 (-),score=124.89 TRINITY_DN50884_c0_g1_i1:17-1807(-)